MKQTKSLLTIISIIMIFTIVGCSPAPVATTTSTTSTTIATTTTEATTTTPVPTTTTLIYPNSVLVTGIPENSVGKLYVHYPENSFQDAVTEIFYDNFKHVIDYNLICEEGAAKYTKMKLRYQQNANTESSEIIKQMPLEGDFCLTGKIEFNWEE